MLKALSDKLGTLTYRFEDSDVYEQLWLFQKFRIDKQQETVTIKANEEFEFILNSIGKNFTRFELDNFTKLRSSYTKELYRHLMQYRNKEWRNGYWVVKVEDFRRALSIPSSYRMTNI
ncbi:replication initiation protein, partial [Enterococcus faecium]|uniref:replication initiation protein n=1 Tax=Enterococcus faecium TaxID=1352 RepID=UPI0034E958A9